jgi:hypothetical protein
MPEENCHGPNWSEIPMLDTTTSGPATPTVGASLRDPRVIPVLVTILDLAERKRPQSPPRSPITRIELDRLQVPFMFD